MVSSRPRRAVNANKVRRSARKRARVEADAKHYGMDYGILPSD
jgi:hypothetical protein